jgi:hypothetical protein
MARFRQQGMACPGTETNATTRLARGCLIEADESDWASAKIAAATPEIQSPKKPIAQIRSATFQRRQSRQKSWTAVSAEDARRALPLAAGSLTSTFLLGLARSGSLPASISRALRATPLRSVGVPGDRTNQAASRTTGAAPGAQRPTTSSERIGVTSDHRASRRHSTRSRSTSFAGDIDERREHCC